MTLTKFPGVKMTLGGAVFVVPALSLRHAQQLQGRLGAYTGQMDAESMELVIDVVHGALQRNYPETTRETVGDLIDLRNMREVMDAVMGVSGMVEAGPSGEAMVSSTGPS